MADLAVVYEHPEWQKPLFAELSRRGIDFVALDIKKNAFDTTGPLPAAVVFNQASPSAYVRGNTRAVPLAMSWLKSLAYRGATVLNGADAFALELSKSAQAALLTRLDIDTPRSIVFNDVELGADLCEKTLGFPALLKPETGGSGARIEVIENREHLFRVLKNDAVWEPDNLFLLQEYLPHDAAFGIVRLEMLGGKLLYPMRVVTHGRFNLCPSPVCNPDDGEGACEIPVPTTAKPVEFYPYPEVPREAVLVAEKIMREGNLDVGGVEYLETPTGRRVFYDVNANSNLRPQVAAAFDMDPFARVVDFLVEKIAQAKTRR